MAKFHDKKQIKNAVETNVFCSIRSTFKESDSIVHNRDSMKFFQTIFKKFDILRIILLFYIEKE